VLLRVAGTDATEQFKQFHKPDVLAKYSPKLKIGVVSGGAAAGAVSDSTVKSSAPVKKERKAPTEADMAIFAKASVAPQRHKAVLIDPSKFGRGVPYGDPVRCDLLCCVVLFPAAYDVVVSIELVWRVLQPLL